jgi:hypothetical protein
MAVQYQIDGDIFREINTHWLYALVSESLIKAHQVDADQTGNSIEYFQLDDGRVFSREVPIPQSIDVSQDAGTCLRNMRSAIREPLSQSR